MFRSVTDIVSTGATQFATAAGTLLAYKAFTTNWGKYFSRFTLLSQTTSDMTSLAEIGALKRARGRKKELTELIAAVNAHGIVVLVGDPGVGKTALMEELAVKTALKENISLKDVRVLKLDFEKIPGGGFEALINKYLKGGQANKFFMNLLDEMATAQGKKKRVLLFLDEFDRIIRRFPGAFNPLLDKLDRNIVIIGATTERAVVERWRKNDESNRGGGESGPGGLTRRIHVIDVQELPPALTIDILKQDRLRFERLLSSERVTTVQDGAIEAAVALTREYKKEGRYPHAAIELLEAAIVTAANKRAAVLQESDIIDFVSTVRKLPAATLATMVKTAKNEIIQQEQFSETHFPLTEYAPTRNPEMNEVAKHLTAYFSQFQVERGKRAGAIVVSTSYKLAENALGACYGMMQESEGPTCHIVECSISDLMKLSRNHTWCLDAIWDTLRKVSLTPSILFIKDGHLLAPRLFPKKTPKSTAPLSLGDAGQELARTVQQAVAGTAAAPLMTEVGRMVTGAAGAAPQEEEEPPLGTSRVIEDVVSALQGGHINYVLAVPPRLADLAKNSGVLCLTMKEFDFFETEQWLTEHFSERELVRKVLYTVWSLRISTGDQSHPADVAYTLLEEARRLAPEGFPRDHQAQELIIQKCPGTRLQEIAHAWQKAQNLEISVISEPADVEVEIPPSISTIVSTFLGRESQKILRLDGTTPAHAALVRKQMKAFLLAQETQFFVMDLSLVKDFPEDLQKALFLRSVRALEEEELVETPILSIEEDDLEKEFVRTALRSLVGRGICRLVCFSKPPIGSVGATSAQSPLERLGESVAAQVTDAVQRFVGGPLIAPARTQPTAPLPQKTPGLEEMAVLSFELPSFTSDDVANLAGTLIPADFPAEAKKALITLYTGLYDERGLTPDSLAENIANDLAYFQIRGAPTQAVAIKHLAEKFQASENEFAYRVDPGLTTRSYRLGRFSKICASKAGSLFMKPLYFFYGHMQTISFALFAAGTIRTFWGRFVGLFRE